VRIGYSCHDAFPSDQVRTLQIYWTLSEVTRLGVDATLIVPALAAPPEDQDRLLAIHYGASSASPRFVIRSARAGPCSGWLARGWFDLRAPRRFGGGYDLVWTRDPVAAAACVRSELATVFETFRPDYATGRHFTLWRRACLASGRLRGVITHSQVAADAYVAAGVPAERCLVARNGVEPSMMEPRLERAAARRLIGVAENSRLAVYAGHVCAEKGIDVLVKAAARVRGATLLLLGVDPGSSEAARVLELARRERASVMLRARVGVADVTPFLYAADCLLVGHYENPARRHRREMLPIKVYSYLAAGRPIVAPRMPDIEEVLSDDTARLVPPFDVDATASAIATILDDAALRAKLGENARRASVHYTWSARAREIVEFLRRVV
jgi:glycosyltransferase involved in cell wall biosynthesis